MIHWLQRGQVPDVPHTAFEVDGKLVYEHCFTRAGFESVYSILYHRDPPHWITSGEGLGRHPGLAAAHRVDPLRRVHIETGKLGQTGTAFLGRRMVAENSDVAVWVARPSESEPTLVANADADELVFVHRGRGRVETPLGTVGFQPHDYVYVPQAMPHRWVLDEPGHLLIIESRSSLRIPKQYRAPEGQLSMYAPFSHRDFRPPEWPPSKAPGQRMLVLSGGSLTACELAHDPFDLVGWSGQLWPFVFPISSFRPRTGQIHLPPTIHTTFAGNGYVVCSFVPRVVDFHERAIPCPYPHSSPDCDEILFYVEGNFTSRKGVDAGSITLHPRGVPHGPHPGTYEASIGSQKTDELAVMLDTFKPLLISENALEIEDAEYNLSWVR
ncbi:MAG: homogentisate 1,2-dioxygenase [bacterium]|nr:homogentisate 1,2-dioxygenase [bacterium]